MPSRLQVLAQAVVVGQRAVVDEAEVGARWQKGCEPAVVTALSVAMRVWPMTCVPRMPGEIELVVRHSPAGPSP